MGSISFLSQGCLGWSEMDEFNVYMLCTGIVGLLITLFALGVAMNSRPHGASDLEEGCAFVTWLFAVVVSIGLIYAAVS